MSALTDLFEGNFGNIGNDLTAHFTQDLPYYLLAATAAVSGAGLAGVGPAAGLFGGGAAAGGAAAAADTGIGAVGWTGAAGEAAVGGTAATGSGGGILASLF